MMALDNNLLWIRMTLVSVKINSTSTNKEHFKIIFAGTFNKFLYSFREIVQHVIPV